MQLIDTHSHLYDTAFDDDRAQAIARAREAGVSHILLPAVDSESHAAMFELVDSDPQLFRPMIGVHPTSVNDNPDYMSELALVEQLLRESPTGRFCAVGEVGLDLYWSRDWAVQQRAVFERHIELALEFNLPLVVHTRDAWEPMLEVLANYRSAGLRGVMHAFSGTYEHYCAVSEVGDFVFGIGGVVTYKRSAVAEVLPRMALSDIVLETDSPYLTPVPFRGKRNESSYVNLVCEFAAQLLGVTAQELAAATTHNAERIFMLK